MIADAVLLFGYGEEQRAISVDLTQEAIDELETTGVHPAKRPDARHASTAETGPPRGSRPPRRRRLRAREARLAERERQLAEQQRVINERSTGC